MADQRNSTLLFLREQHDQLVKQSRKTIEETRDLTHKPAPDTFLGRKTYEPFPNDLPSEEEAN